MGKIDKNSGKTHITKAASEPHLCTVNLKHYKMTVHNKSIFNLIEIFRQGKRQITNTLNAKAHCTQRSHHDFYCDAERPFISAQK